MYRILWTLLSVGTVSLIAQEVFTGHSDKVVALATHPGSAWAASGSYDNYVIFWRVDKGTYRWKKVLHSVAVKDVAVAPDGRKMATCGMDKAVKIWDVPSGKLLLSLPPHPGGVYAVAFHPSAPYLATACFDGNVRIFDYRTRKLLEQMSHNGRVNDVAFSPDGRWIAGVSGDPFSPDSGNLKIWDGETGQEIFSWNQPVKELRKVLFTPDGKYLVVGGAPATVYVFTHSAGQWKLLGGLKGFQFGVYALAVDAEGKYLAIGGGDMDKKIYLYTLPRFKRVKVLEGHQAKVNDLAFLKDGRLLSASDDNTVRLWKLR